MIIKSDSCTLFFSGRETTLFLSEDPKINQKILIKVLYQEKSSVHANSEFENELNLSSQAQIPVVRRVLGKTIFEGNPALILEYIDGYTIDSYISNKILQMDDFFSLAIRITRAMDSLHQEKIIHKNLSGLNILIDKEKNIRFIDFGIAVKIQSGMKQKPNFGVIEGTLPYIPPEQTGRVNIDISPGSDLYSLGILFYHMVTGVYPFETNELLELIHAHIANIPVTPKNKNHEIPEQVSRIIMHLLEKDPQNRYRSARGLLKDLEICFTKWNTKGTIELFFPGMYDLTGELFFPNRLYGREKEIEDLQTEYLNTTKGKSGILLVSGFSRTGKTSLVREIIPYVISSGGFFIEGKFDPAKQAGPYSAWITALTNLVDIILSLPDNELTWWKNRIIKNDFSREDNNPNVISEDIVVPHTEIIQDIRLIVISGDYRKLEDKLHDIQKSNPEYLPFCKNIEYFSAKYDEKSIIDYLETTSVRE